MLIPGLFRYISWFYYGYSALLVNQWSGVENISCPQKISETMGGTNMTGVETACLTTGDQVLATLSIHEVNNKFLLYYCIVLYTGKKREIGYASRQAAF